MLTKVKLLGELGRKFGREHTFDIDTHIEAFKALGANNASFWRELELSGDRGVGYKIFVEMGNKEFAYLDEETLGFPAAPTLIIAPVPCGSGGNYGMIILGVALIAFAGPLGGMGVLGLTAANFTLVGAALVLSGVSGLLTPRTKASTPTEEKSRNSFVFNGTTNVNSPGYPVPIVYGTYLVGSIVISSGITTSSIAQAHAIENSSGTTTSPTTQPPTTGGGFNIPNAGS